MKQGDKPDKLAKDESESSDDDDDGKEQMRIMKQLQFPEIEANSTFSPDMCPKITKCLQKRIDKIQPIIKALDERGTLPNVLSVTGAQFLFLTKFCFSHRHAPFERNLSNCLTATKVEGASREESPGHRWLHGPGSKGLYGWIGEWFYQTAWDLGMPMIFMESNPFAEIGFNFSVFEVCFLSQKNWIDVTYPRVQKSMKKEFLNAKRLLGTQLFFSSICCPMYFQLIFQSMGDILNLEGY